MHLHKKCPMKRGVVVGKALYVEAVAYTLQRELLYNK